MGQFFLNECPIVPIPLDECYPFTTELPLNPCQKSAEPTINHRRVPAGSGGDGVTG